MPGFGLKVTAKENQLTGTRSSCVLTQIDDETYPRRSEIPLPRRLEMRRTGMFTCSGQATGCLIAPYIPVLVVRRPASAQQIVDSPWLIDRATLTWSTTPYRQCMMIGSRNTVERIRGGICLTFQRQSVSAFVCSQSVAYDAAAGPACRFDRNAMGRRSRFSSRCGTIHL